MRAVSTTLTSGRKAGQVDFDSPEESPAVSCSVGVRLDATGMRSSPPISVTSPCSRREEIVATQGPPGNFLQSPERNEFA
jgi:hypothetical protein